MVKLIPGFILSIRINLVTKSIVELLDFPTKNNDLRQ